MTDRLDRARATAPASHRLLAVAAISTALLGPAACGNNPGLDEAPIPDEIEFPAEERRLLMNDSPPAAPSGPVSGENYRQQLESLEAELRREEDESTGTGSSSTGIRQSSSP